MMALLLILLQIILPIQRADYLIFQSPTGGYGVVRTWDNVLLSYSYDAAAAVNVFFKSFGSALYNDATAPNPRFHQGLRIECRSGDYHAYQTLVIPPSQGLIFDCGHVVWQTHFNGSDAIRLDSSLDSIFELPVVSGWGNDGNTLIRIKPEHLGPDKGLIPVPVFSNGVVITQAVTGSGDGIVLDGSQGAINNSEFSIYECNLFGGRCYYLTPANYSVGGNRFKLLHQNQAGQAAEIANSWNLQNNEFHFNVANADLPITDNSPTRQIIFKEGIK